MEDIFEDTLSCVVVVAVWILLSVLTGRLADKKGLPSGKYFLLSLLLSPVVGLLAVAAAVPNRVKAEELRISAGDERKCPSCAELVKREAKICRFCQRELPPPEPIEGAPRFKTKAEYDAWKGTGGEKDPDVPGSGS